MTIPIIRPGESLPPDYAFAYSIAKDGFYLKKRGPFFEACVRVPEIPTLDEEEESYQFNGPKIPATLFSKILAFFEGVRVKHGTEAAALLLFEGGCWSAVVPEQRTSGCSVKYRVPPGVRPAGSIHSHPGFSARFSRTDEEDEAVFDGLHIVVADTGFVRPGVSVAAVVSGRRIELDVEDIVEGFDDQSDFPAEWLALVKPEVGQKPLFEEDPDVAVDAERALNPLCSSCASIGICTLDPPGPGEFCHMFAPGGAEESRR